MLILRVVTKQARNAYCYQVPRCLTTQAKPKDIMDFKKQRLPALQPKKQKREPFAKNLFLGKVDYELLAYPEPQQPDRWNEFQEWIMPLKEYMKTVNPQEFETINKVPSHVLQNLRELGIFGARIHEDYKGHNLLHSELMQVLETLGQIPALGFFFLKHAVPVVDVLTKYGTVEQKFQYLPKIALGHCMASIAMTEKTTGPMASNIETVAVLSKDEQYWILDGEKTFVSNADIADMFVVFGHAMQSGYLEKRNEIVSSFIVDRDTEGLTVIDSPMDTLGLKGYNTNKIILKNVKIPKSNMIGEVGDGGRQIVDLFTGGRHFVASLIISLLKRFVDLLTTECLQKKYFNVPLYDTVFAQTTINNLNLTIYAIESALYMTTGLMDIYEDQDIQLETALVEQYAVQECFKIIQESMWLVGPKVCTGMSPFEQILRDAFTLTNFETQLHDTRIFSGLLGIAHVGKVNHEKFQKLRNPLQYPQYLFKGMSKRLFQNDRLNLEIDEYLHQSLRECATFDDKCLFKLLVSTETLLVRYGQYAADQHVELQRLSDMVSQIYVLTCALSRASRSYCIGNRHSELEVSMSQLIAHRVYKLILQISDDIDKGKYINGDFGSEELSRVNFESKHYYPAHPLQRNY